ncbi:MAG TPA: pyocin knob domain-containing protein [Nitrososphaera sp.]|jgi:hypothetical protein
MSTISGHTVRASGTILTAAIYNADHLNHITNALALNADKLEGASPPTVDGHIAVFDGVSGAVLRDGGYVAASTEDLDALEAALTAAIALKVAKAGDTMTGALTTVGLKWTRAIQLAVSTDLNTITDAGFYDGQTLTNAPDTGWWYILVQQHSNSANWVTQTAWELDSAGADQMHVRWRRDGTWTAWRQILNSNDLSDQATAEAGTNNTKWMSPLRTAQAIATLAKTVDLPAASTVFDNATIWDTGILASTARAGFLIKQDGSSGAAQVSLDGGTNYTTFLTGGNIDAIGMLFVDGPHARIGTFSIVISSNETGLSVTPNALQQTITVGAGNIKLKGSTGQDWIGFKVMG